MLIDYIQGAQSLARYRKIKDPNPYYGEIPGFSGVWATGKTREECRRRLEEALEGWIIVRLRKGLPLPKVRGIVLKDKLNAQDRVSRDALLAEAYRSQAAADRAVTDDWEPLAGEGL